MHWFKEINLHRISKWQMNTSIHLVSVKSVNFVSGQHRPPFYFSAAMGFDLPWCGIWLFVFDDLFAVYHLLLYTIVIPGLVRYLDCLN